MSNNNILSIKDQTKPIKNNLHTTVRVSLKYQLSNVS